MKIHISFIILFFNTLIVYSQNWSSQADSIEYFLELETKIKLNHEDSIFIVKKSLDNCSQIDSFIKNKKYSGIYKTYLTKLLILNKVCLNVVIGNLDYYQLSLSSIRMHDEHNYPIIMVFEDDLDLENTFSDIIIDSDFLDNCEIFNSFSESSIKYLAYLLRTKINSINVNNKDYTKCKKSNLELLKRNLLK